MIANVKARLPQGRWILLAMALLGTTSRPTHAQSNDRPIDAVVQNRDQAERPGGTRLAKQQNDAVENGDARDRRRYFVRGRITDPSKRPLEGVKVSAHCGIGTLRQTGSTTTDANGRYTLRFGPGLLMGVGKDRQFGVGTQAATISPHLPGWYEVNFHRQGNLAMTDEPLDEEARTAFGGYVAVVLPKTPYQLDFIMAQGATIQGRLVNDFGRPIAGEQISLDGDELPPSCSVLATAETDQEGRFHFEDVPLRCKWHFKLRVHGTRHELTTGSFEFDDAKRSAMKLVLKSAAAAEGAVQLKLSLQDSDDK